MLMIIFTDIIKIPEPFVKRNLQKKCNYWFCGEIYVKLFMKTVLVLTNIGISEAVVQKGTSCEFRHNYYENDAQTPSGQKNTKVDRDIKWCIFPIMFQVRMWGCIWDFILNDLQKDDPNINISAVHHLIID